MTAPDSRAPFIQRCYTCGRESPHGPLLHYPGCEVGATTHAVAGFTGEAALARGPQQAGGDSVSELVALLRTRADAHGGDKLLSDAADCLQALDRLRLEEAKQLAADCLHMYDRFAAAQERAETAEAALRLAHSHLDMPALRVSHCKDAAAIDAARLVRDGDSGEG